ncbi:hypothetical protein TELCIR_09405, partial [Teladorsagia circumcincta]
PKERHTDWNAVAMAGLITFLSAVENTVVGMSEWPYMHTIDPDATSQFFGLVSSVSKLGHAAFAVVFAFWAYKTHSIKAPLIVGRAIAFFSCCVYLCVEVLPYGRRFLMLFCYFLFGVAGMCQLAFTHMPYPGYEIIENFLKFHIYSAPIWIASATNFISVAIIWFGLRDVPSSGKRDSDGAMFSVEGIKKRIRLVLSLNLAWALIVLCWVERNHVTTCDDLVWMGRPADETAGSGCNPEEYTWCDTAYSTWPVLFLPITCVVMGVGVPTAAIALDTIYSKILGNIDQSMMQGAMVVVEDIVYILGPIYAATIAKKFATTGII